MRIVFLIICLFYSSFSLLVNSLPDYDFFNENDDDGNQCDEDEMKCGVNAECTIEDFASCNCLKGFAGDPFKICYENPCGKNVCGKNTSCKIEGNDVTCKCLEGFVGNPLLNCWKIGDDICYPNPCGNNSFCIREPTPVCICLPEYFGEPPNCREGCTSNNICAQGQYCNIDTNKCVNGCRNDGSCATDEYCDRSSSEEQKCKKDNEFCSSTNVCRKGCTFDHHCKDNEFCNHFTHECINPCNDPKECGSNSMCRSTDHSSSIRCSCEDGFTPIPYEGCQKASVNETITTDKVNCSKYCAKYAKCELFEEKVECFCPDESFNKILNPFDSCIISLTGQYEFSDICYHKNRPECPGEISPSLVASLLG